MNLHDQLFRLQPKANTAIAQLLDQINPVMHRGRRSYGLEANSQRRLIPLNISAFEILDSHLKLADHFSANLRAQQNSIARIVSVVLDLVTANLQHFPIVASNLVTVQFRHLG
jgi:hypothetical protein